MVESLVKISGSLFIGGIGLAIIVASLLVGAVLINVIWEHCKKDV